MNATVHIVADRGAYPVLAAQAPVAVRATPHALYLVGSAAGPIGGDGVDMDVVVAPSTTLVVRSTAASVVLPGPGPSRTCVRATVGRDATLVWAPEPLVLTSQARHVVDVRVEIDERGRVAWREEAVRGRAGERGGRARLRTAIDQAGEPLLRHELAIGPEADTYPLLGAAQAYGAYALVGLAAPAVEPNTRAEHAVFALDSAGTLVTALGEVSAVRAILDGVERRVLCATPNGTQ